MTVEIRDATEADLAATLAIYNDVIDTSDAIWLDDHVTAEDHLAWFRSQAAGAGPVLVAVDRSGTVIGYGCWSQFRAKTGYWPTVEHTIHVAAGHRRRGVGQLLLDALTGRAEAEGRSVMVAGLDGGNAESYAFHLRNGFREVARMPGIGRRYGRRVDLVLLQKELAPAPPSTDRAEPS